MAPGIKPMDDQEGRDGLHGAGGNDTRRFGGAFLVRAGLVRPVPPLLGFASDETLHLNRKIATKARKHEKTRGTVRFVFSCFRGKQL